MKVRELRLGLLTLAGVLESWGTKTAANDLNKLSELMSEFDEESVSRFVEQMKGRSLTRTPKVSRAADVDEQAVEEYRHKLNGATSSTLNQAIEELRSDKGIRLKELQEIAKALGAPSTSRSKKAAIDLLYRHCLGNLREQGVFSSIESMFRKS